MRAKGMVLGAGIALALAALPAGAEAGLIVPKSQAAAPVTTPEAAVPQAPAPSPAPNSVSSSASAPAPAPSVPEAGAGPEPGASPKASQGQSPAPHSGTSQRGLESERALFEEQIRLTKLALQERIDQRNPIQIGNETLVLADLQRELDRVNKELANLRTAAAAQAAARAAQAAKEAQEQADLADEFAYNHDTDAQAEQRALVDELAIEMGYPPDGSYAGIVNSILNIFQQPQPAPQPTAQFASPTPLGELIAPILALFPSREQADSTSKS